MQYDEWKNNLYAWTWPVFTIVLQLAYKIHNGETNSRGLKIHAGHNVLTGEKSALLFHSY